MKAVLVIDNVDCCGRCPLLDRGYPFSCIYTGKVIHTDALCSHREKDCPLRPLPQKKEVEVNEIEDIMHTEYSIEDIYTNKYVATIRLATDKLISLGWNACLDEILGENDENISNS